MSSMPQTPPDVYADNDLKFAFHLSAIDALSERPAVGFSQLEVEGVKSSSEREPVVDLGLGETHPDWKNDALDALLLAAVTATDTHLSHHHAQHTFDDDHNVDIHDWHWVGGEVIRSRQASRNVRLGYHSHAPSVVGDHSLLSSLTGSPAFKPSSHFGRGAYSLPITPLSLSRDSSVSSSGSTSPAASSALLAEVVSVGVRNSDIAVPIYVSAQSVPIDVQVKCMVRTRVPTPHGEVFLHLYHNNRDNKEHLAIVVDPVQLDSHTASRPHASFIRSKTLDSVWNENETAEDRITRGAYVGRLSEAGYTASSPEDAEPQVVDATVPAPLVRIHSECFTGETIGSMRCDCGEQLDEAIRRISQDIEYIDSTTGTTHTIPGRGAVIYMRQEGRGIGLLSKLRAYNLQDLGYDTVQANLMLGHGADERGYDVAAAIMHDLGLGAGEPGGVRLLTNNPDKVEKLTQAGVHISEQVDMVPRAWRCQSDNNDTDSTITNAKITNQVGEGESAARLRSAGATLIGGGVTHGPELEKYLRTKVLRMGHMLSLPSS